MDPAATLGSAVVLLSALLPVPWIAYDDGREAMAAGRWGGSHIELEITDDGATVDYDCAHGRLTEQLRPDRDGRFSAQGTYVPERPGPAREGEGDRGAAARYEGRVEGDTMTLTVTLAEDGHTVGTFTLTRGRRGRLRKCL